MQTDKKDLLHRIKIIKGHIQGIEKMIENEEYCINVIHQSLAVQKALKKLDSLVIKDHINHCVVEQAKVGDTDKITKDLLTIFEYK